MKSVKRIGSRREVMNGSAKQTSGGLTKKDLFYKTDKNGVRRIKSKKASAAGKKSFKHLVKAGCKPVKGKFGCPKRKTMRKARKGRKSARKSRRSK